MKTIAESKDDQVTDSDEATISTMPDLPPPAHGKLLPLLGSISVPSRSLQSPRHTNPPPWTGELQGLTRMDLKEVWWQQRLHLPLLPSEGEIWGDLLHGPLLPPKVYVDDSAALVEGKMGLKRPEPLREKGSRSLLRFCLNTDGSCVDMSTPSTSSVPSFESRSVRTAASEIERREYRRSKFTEVMVEGPPERGEERVEREGMAKGKKQKQKQKQKKSLRRKIWNGMKGLVGKSS